MEREMHGIHNLMERYLDNTISEDDRLELIKILRQGHADEALKDKIGETLRAEILSGDKPSESEKSMSGDIFEQILADDRPSHNRFAAFVQYAASLLILAVVGSLLYFQKTDDHPSANSMAITTMDVVSKANTGNETQRISLPDGSVILLEPGGEVRYPEKFGKVREVSLSGEAFFEVTKDAAHPFLVYANEVTTKVLGTSFRIKANREEKEVVVAVKTGKVSVSAKSINYKFRDASIDEITLTPNQQAIYDRREHVVVKKVVEKPVVVTEQAALKSSYINEQIVQILTALSESYAVDIRYNAEALSGCTLTSDIIEAEGLFDQLDIICSALGGSYTLENDASIVIESNGCSNVKP